MMSHGNLMSSMKTNIALKMIPDMNWSIDEIENLTPFEKEAYVYLITETLKERKKGS